MSAETRTCASCKNSFVVEPEDFTFYERMKVPPPTWCPECRMVRRMVFRDYRVLYKRKSDRTGNTIFSIFHPQAPVKVWERDIWWSDDWDIAAYARDIDFSRPFLEQLKELFFEVPFPSQTSWGIVNSDYCSGANDLKNCYLVFVATHNEDCAYSAEINQTKSSLDVTRIESSELCYESFALTKCYKTFFSSHCENCTDIWFSRNLIGCSFCFGCTNLRNKQYHLFNEPCTKEAYEKAVREFDLGSFRNLLAMEQKVGKTSEQSIRKFAEGRYNTNVSGEYLNNSKNVHLSYYTNQVEDSKYLQLFLTPGSKDCYDCTLWGENVERVYECSSIGTDSYNIKFSSRTYKGSKDCEYSFYCVGCSDIFGCAGLRNKQYCILNKQYTKEEYEELVPKVRELMDKLPYKDTQGKIYRYGEFFPPEFSPFAYNESVAQDYFPLTKEQAVAQGFLWHDPETKQYSVTKKSSELPDHIKDVKDDILEETIGCAHEGKCNHQCTVAFRLIKEELQFYRRMGLPLPRLCHNCRHCERLKHRNHLKLHHRRCQCAGKASENGVYANTVEHQHGEGKCPNEFETSYAPERPEIVYCETCYQSEVV